MSQPAIAQGHPFVANAFKKNICRDCRQPQEAHGMGEEKQEKTHQRRVSQFKIRSQPLGAEDKPIKTSGSHSRGPSLTTDIDAANGNGNKEDNMTPKPVPSSAPLKSFAAPKAAANFSSAAASTTSATPVAKSSAPVTVEKRSQPCGEFKKHLFKQNICANCSFPLDVHTALGASSAAGAESSATDSSSVKPEKLTSTISNWNSTIKQKTTEAQARQAPASGGAKVESRIACAHYEKHAWKKGVCKHCNRPQAEHAEDSAAAENAVTAPAVEKPAVLSGDIVAAKKAFTSPPPAAATTSGSYTAAPKKLNTSFLTSTNASSSSTSNTSSAPAPSAALAPKSACSSFMMHKFKKNICANCNLLLNQHSPETQQAYEEDQKAASEKPKRELGYKSETHKSDTILPASTGTFTVPAPPAASGEWPERPVAAARKPSVHERAGSLGGLSADHFTPGANNYVDKKIRDRKEAEAEEKEKEESDSIPQIEIGEVETPATTVGQPSAHFKKPSVTQQHGKRSSASLPKFKSSKTSMDSSVDPLAFFNTPSFTIPPPPAATEPTHESAPQLFDVAPHEHSEQHEHESAHDNEHKSVHEHEHGHEEHSAEPAAPQSGGLKDFLSMDDFFSGGGSSAHNGEDFPHSSSKIGVEHTAAAGAPSNSQASIFDDLLNDSNTLFK